MSLAVVDAHKHQDVVRSDVPNAFVQAALKCNDGDECTTMKIAGVLVDTLVADNPDLCGGNVVCENGKKVSCVMVLRAICGMLISALLQCRKFREQQCIGPRKGTSPQKEEWHVMEHQQESG